MIDISDAIEVTTETQLRYHLERGEIVIYTLSDGTSCVLRKASDDCYECLAQRGLGSVEVWVTDTLESVAQAFNYLRDRGVEFWVLPGARVAYQPARILDRVADFLRNLFGRG